MVSHTDARDRLVALADGALTTEERRSVEDHVRTCPRCRGELAGLRRLNAALNSFAPAPPVAFRPFWFHIKAALPNRRPSPFRVPGLGRQPRLALAFALAATVALVLSSAAFAAGSALPDNPLYALKRLGEQVQLGLASGPQARAHLDLQLAGVRLREAQAMAGIHEGALAAASLREFNRLVSDAGPNLSSSDIESLRADLAGLAEIDASRDDSQLTASIQDTELVLSEDEASSQSGGVTVGQDAHPTLAAHPTPKPHPGRGRGGHTED